jgi:aryl-alcohol dehydrogenase-like predicted oxidoreductase
LSDLSVRKSADSCSLDEDDMKPRPLGRTGLDIAPLVLGGNVFGFTVDERRSFELFDRAAAAGLNTIDTADSYSTWVPGNVGGESETIIGKWLKRSGLRERTIVITKAGSAVGPYKNDLTAKHILAAAEDSLRRLQTDYIDLYFSHWPDPTTPIEETLGAHQTLLRQGKVRAIGASNYSAAQLQEALSAAARLALPRYEALQPEYNLYSRDSFEGPLRDLCVREGLGVITYFSLASGFLTGKYRSPEDLGQSPRGQVVGKYLDARGMRILEALDAVASSHQASMAEVALAWLMAQPGVTAPIASATSLAQLEGLIRATTLSLSGEELQTLTAASN